MSEAVFHCTNMFQWLLLSILCSKNISQWFLELNLYLIFKSFSWHCIWDTAAYICLKSDNTCKSLDISFLHILCHIQINFHISIHISSTRSDLITSTKSSRRNEMQYLIYSWVDALIYSKVCSLETIHSVWEVHELRSTVSYTHLRAHET